MEVLLFGAGFLSVAPSDYFFSYRRSLLCFQLTTFNESISFGFVWIVCILTTPYIFINYSWLPVSQGVHVYSVSQDIYI